MRKPISLNTRQNKRSLRWKLWFSAIPLATVPLPALANLRDPNIDHITTGSIASQAMIWTIDPFIVLALLGLFCAGLALAAFALLRRSLRDGVKGNELDTRSYK